MLQNKFQSFEETLCLKPDGKIKVLKIKGAPLTNSKGKIEKMIGVDMDITLVREAEEKITELNTTLSAKNRELETVNSELRTFSSLAASDYKNTLKNLYTLFEFILTNDASHLSNNGRANLRRAQSAIQKMKLLTDDIIAYSQVQIAEKDIETVDLNEIIDIVRQKLDNRIKEANATIESERLPVIKGYPDLIQLLFYHLLNNAIKFRKEDTPPLIRIIGSQVNGSYLNHADAIRDTWYNMISISDNGIGFEQKQAEKIFSIFSRLHEKSKYKGSGIGLAICKKIMNIHDGFITVESTPDKGTTFNCFFLVQTPLPSIQYS
jgi:light-regulated signal transduction histidine kinase (bacteriophytochrome)